MKLQKTNDQENISKAVILQTGNKNKNVLKFLIKKIQAEKIYRENYIFKMLRGKKEFYIQKNPIQKLRWDKDFLKQMRADKIYQQICEKYWRKFFTEGESQMKNYIYTNEWNVSEVVIDTNISFF